MSPLSISDTFNRRWSLLSVASLAALSCFASQPADTIRHPEHVLDELEVTANAVSSSVASTAPSFTISQEKMKQMGITDISDALHRLPGLNLRDYGGAGGMKTVSVRGFGDTHTGVVYDGVVISDCQTGRIDLSRYSLDNLGDLSLVIGDNSDIFISAKSAASPAVITLSSLSLPNASDNDWHFTGQLKIGSFGTISPFLRLGKSFNGKFSFSATGEFTHAKNNYPFRFKNGKTTMHARRENSMMNSGHGDITLRWTPLPGSTFDWKLYYYDNDRQLPGPVVLYNPECNETLRDRNFFGQMSYRNTTINRLTLQILGKFNWDASLYHDENGKYSGGVYDEDYYQRELYFSGIALYKPVQRVELAYAADYSFNNLSSNQPQEPHPYRHSVLQSLTGKFKNSWLLATARLLWSIYDNEVRTGESARDANKLSPSVSVSVQPFRNSLFFLRASYKNILRMPTFNDSYFFHLGSISLKPEDTNQLNIGVTYQLPWTPMFPYASFTADVYMNNVKDKIVAIPKNMFIWNMMNVDKVKAVGVDITANVTAAITRDQNIVFAGNYSYQRVMPKTHPLNPDYNKQVAYTPKHSGAFSITWENPWVNAVFHATGASDRYGTNSNLPVSRIDGYMECGFALYRTFRLRSHALDLRADLMNMFDKQYEIVAQYPMPGISWRLTATFRL